MGTALIMLPSLVKYFLLTTLSMQTCLLKDIIHNKYDAYLSNRYEKRVNLVRMSFRRGRVCVKMGPSWRGPSWRRSELSMIPREDRGRLDK